MRCDWIMTEGIVFDIQRFCVDDGPGIRTTVFLKGCPLHCVWCHNAESLSAKPQLYGNLEKCTRCGRCEAVCGQKVHRVTGDSHQISFENCIACGACAEACPSEVLRIVGKSMTAEAVMEEVIKDRLFYETSGGGMTLSGGEPLLQGAFSVALAKSAKEQGLHVCVETCGFGKKETLQSLAAYTDMFLFDFKHSNPQLHRQYTGVDRKQIEENLRLLEKLQKPVILRCPIIPGCNDSENHYCAIGALASSMKNIMEIHLEPYHPFGVNKYAAIGKTAAYTRQEMMDKQEVEQAAEIVRSITTVPVLVK